MHYYFDILVKAFEMLGGGGEWSQFLSTNIEKGISASAQISTHCKQNCMYITLCH